MPPLDALPVGVIQLILRFATCCEPALSTSPVAILQGQKDTINRHRHFRADILSSLSTKVALSLVSKRIAEISEEFLLEAVFINAYDLLASLVKLLGSPSISDKTRLKGSHVKRLDFRLGRLGRYWSGEGHQKHFRNLYRLLPHLTSLSLLFIDPYVTNYLLKEEINLKLPKSFWKILTGTCGSTLRLLSVGNVEVDPRHLLVAVEKLENLESLELQGGWYGAVPYIPLKSNFSMNKLHHLHAYIVEALPGLVFPALQNTFVSSNMAVFEPDAFGGKIGTFGLTRFTHCGPSVDIFELCFRFPNMQHFAVHKLRNSHFTHAWWHPHTPPTGNEITPNGSVEEMTGDDSGEEGVPSGTSPNHATTISQAIELGTNTKKRNTMGTIYSLRSITIYHYHPWPFGRSILDNILELCELQALPGLEEVKYVEHDGWVRKDSNVSEVDKVLSEMKDTFGRVGVEFISERRCLNLD